ncbi:hypothetical protein ONS96_013696 [Cadophora gregata f. sp. sojae]|nr:hypothetical protein ONS96_013696 [Cadophora gregata f. sp. sojae]
MPTGYISITSGRHVPRPSLTLLRICLPPRSFYDYTILLIIRNEVDRRYETFSFETACRMKHFPIQIHLKCLPVPWLSTFIHSREQEPSPLRFVADLRILSSESVS